MVIFEILAPQISGIFALSSSILAICTSAMRIISAGFIFVAINIAFQGIFQALGKGGYSLWISLIRMLIVSLPLAWIFVQITGNSLTFLAFPIAEACGTVVSLLLYKKLKKMIHA
jgi:Na+-driven multidrug efflux pump